MEEMGEWFAELLEGAKDFYEDLAEVFLGERPRRERKPIRTNLYGSQTLVRPAYIFATRVNALVKIIAGVSVLGSALLATLWGYASTKDLIAALISSPGGRFVAAVLGFSALTVGLWEFTRRREREERRAASK